MSFDPVEHVQLVRVETRAIKTLRGFQKFHRVPDSAGARETRMLHEICVPELNDLLDSVFSKLRTEFQLKRKELVVSEIEAGCGMISTPKFQFSVECELDPEKPSQALFKSFISNIESPSALCSEAFSRVFENTFNELLVSVPEPLSIEDVVDLLEETEPQGTQLSYDKHCTFCELQFSEAAALVRMDPSSISIRVLQPGPPQVLFELFVQIKETLQSILDFQSKAWATI